MKYKLEFEMRVPGATVQYTEFSNDPDTDGMLDRVIPCLANLLPDTDAQVEGTITLYVYSENKLMRLWYPTSSWKIGGFTVREWREKVADAQSKTTV